MHGANCKYHWLIIIPGLIYNTRKKSGLNVTSAEILYGNDLIFDFCCISRCSGEMLLTKASPCKPLQTKLASRCASLLWYTWFARFTTFLPYPLPSDSRPNLTMIQLYVANMSRGHSQVSLKINFLNPSPPYPHIQSAFKTNWGSRQPHNLTLALPYPIEVAI